MTDSISLGKIIFPFKIESKSESLLINVSTAILEVNLKYFYSYNIIDRYE